ncbi:hypothetical protein OE903_04410 [Bacillus sp. B6(2022)]|nr:hypothetical protein [Bacillus sp. B6(2022)]
MTQMTFGLYEGFLGLLANVVVILILNPFFQKNVASNSVTSDLFEKNGKTTEPVANKA